jgi:hypothetical protein
LSGVSERSMIIPRGSSLNLQYYEERHREQQVRLLKKRAAKLGLQLVAPEVG